MTHADGAMWLIFAIGIYAGWAYRGWSERRAKRDASPEWMGKLGHALSAQFYRVDQSYRFIGEGPTISNTQTYEGGGHAFQVTVTRKPSVTIDL
jgi:hypothetical protein